MSSTAPPPRRSARLSIKSEPTENEYQEEEEVKPPPVKKAKGRPRKSAVIPPKDKVVGNTENQDEAPPSSDQTDVKPTAEELSAPPPASTKNPRKRERQTKVKSEPQAGSSASAMVKVESQSSSIAGPSEPQPEAGPSQVKAKGKGKAKAKVEKVVDPKKARMARLRDKCPKTIVDRYKRAISQRMFMIERERLGEGHHQYEQFKVLGSTGNVYTINIGPIPRCDCPDNLKGNKPCKHIIFVFIKVLKVPDDSSIWFQMSLTPEEVEQVFATSPPTPNGSVTVNVKVHKAYLHATGRGGEEEEVVTGIDKEIKDASDGKRMDAVGEDCPVCYEEMTQEDVDGKKLVYDETLTGCGKPLHNQCFQMWAMTVRTKGEDVTCVWCRSPWPTDDAGNGKGKGKSSGPQYSSMGYLNMAAEAGMSRERDVRFSDAAFLS
uniref:SWIM-type domain-containing protein n=1 Tax=Kwoniella bestiolae CBS 10118 TaxID=1296100 RepID=A0A1B9FR37_9TREE|nr:hypothetical protein I302_08898 [Kwoniella bestiolae CBS 10118]OCF21226.1 hypothetical protein I302_08898 [Kwoniella bestiolae CBS 10118]